MTSTVVQATLVRPRCPQTRRKPGASVEQRIYAGQEHDAASGLSYMGARYYDAVVGRFLSEDPVFLELGTDAKKTLSQYGYDRNLQDLLSNPQEMNSYCYATNNPLINIDPNGLASVYVRQAGPWNSGNTDLKQQAGHTMIKVGDTYYGFALTSAPGNDVQKFSQSKFDETYAGQSWSKVDIGDKFDGKLAAYYNGLESNGNTEDGTYRIASRNCAETATNALESSGALGGMGALMGKPILPGQVLAGFKAISAVETVANAFMSIIGRGFDPLVKSITAVTVPKKDN